MTRTEKLAEALVRLQKSPPNPNNSKPHSSTFSLPLIECIHLGTRVPGQPCGSQLYHCNKHKAITTRFIKCSGAELHCATCKDYERPQVVIPDDTHNGGFPAPPSKPTTTYSFQPVKKRHFIYHLLPVSGNGVWRKGIEQLRHRWHLFTGRKIVAVAQGLPIRERIDPVEKVPGSSRVLTLDSVETVRNSLPSDVEVVGVPNDPALWEGVSWPILWSEILNTANRDDAVLYAHGKGVTRKLTSPCHVWTDILYRLSLDFWPLIEKELRTKPIVGALPKWGPFFGGVLRNSQWHYSGNFWWSRVEAVRSKIESIKLPLNAWAPEAWVGAAFHSSEAGYIFSPKTVIKHLYHPHETDKLASEFDQWLSKNQVSQTDTNNGVN